MSNELILHPDLKNGYIKHGEIDNDDIEINDQVLEQLAKMGKLGYRREQIAVALDIEISTLQRMIKHDKRIVRAIERGKLSAFNNASRGMQLLADQGDFKACAFVLSKRFGWGQSDQPANVINIDHVERAEVRTDLGKDPVEAMKIYQDMMK